jgi:hypothetical protein
MKGLRLYLIIGGVLLTLYIIAQFSQGKEINWTETLSSKDKIPFGAYVIHDRLNDIFPKATIKEYHDAVYSVIAEDSLKNSSYIIICPQLELTKYDYRKLTEYLKRGNDVFIAAESFRGALANELDLNTGIHVYFLKKTIVPVKLVSPHLDSTKLYRIDKGCTTTSFIGFDTTTAVVVGKDTSNKANFIRFRFGKGNLYLSSNPKAFSNYSMLTADGAKYAATMLSYVKNTSTIAWDEYYTGEEDEKSLMEVFFGNRYLQWAYYTTLAAMLLFVLYEMKRRQRIIPVITPLKNSTVEFVNVVGQVYYEKRNNADIAHKQVTYMLSHLREEYHLKTDKLNEEFVEKLTGKLGLDEEFAHEFVKYLVYIQIQDRVDDNELIYLNKLIEQFYKKSS